MKKNEKLLIGFTCVVDFSVSSAKRYLCVIHSGSQKRIGTRKSSASPQASVTCIILWKMKFIYIFLLHKESHLSLEDVGLNS